MVLEVGEVVSSELVRYPPISYVYILLRVEVTALEKQRHANDICEAATHTTTAKQTQTTLAKQRRTSDETVACKQQNRSFK